MLDQYETLIIKVNEFGISNEDDVIVLGFNAGEDSENCLVLQFSNYLSESDIKLGHTKYFIGSCDGTIGDYDCLDNIKLISSSIEFIFKSSIIKEFGFKSVRVEMKEGDFEIAKPIIIERFQNEEVEILNNNI